MTHITRVLHLDNILPFEADVLACDPAQNQHVFVDTRGCGPLRCLCSEHAWQDDEIAAIYYPAIPYPQEEQPDE